MTGLPEQEHYRTAAADAVMTNMSMMSVPVLANVVITAADGAVMADRQRMAEQIRMRVLQHKTTGLPADLAMKVDELILDLADQVEHGLSTHSPEPD